MTEKQADELLIILSSIAEALHILVEMADKAQVNDRPN
jgi:hypothetical protein